MKGKVYNSKASLLPPPNAKAIYGVPLESNNCQPNRGSLALDVILVRGLQRNRGRGRQRDLFSGSDSHDRGGWRGVGKLLGGPAPKEPGTADTMVLSLDRISSPLGNLSLL